MRKILLFLAFCIALPAFAQENLLDTSYGASNGFTTHAFYNANGQMTNGFHFNSSVKLPDGKILTVGASFIARFTANGLLDTTFNGTGYKYFYPDRAYLKITAANDGNYIVMDMAGNLEKIDADGNPVSSFFPFGQLSTFVDFFVDPSGKIYLLKRSNYNYTMVRLLSSGIQDVNFGTAGEIALGSTYRYAEIKVNAANEIFLGGKHEIAVNNRKLLMTKLKADGTLDPAFGTGGHFMQQAGEYVGDTVLFDLLDNGKILGFTSGSLCNGNNCFGLIMYRLNANGTLDTSFKNTGISVMPIQSNSTPCRLERLPDNSYIISGTGMRTYYALKMDSDGNPDPLFGQNGRLMTPQLGASTGTPVYNSGFEIYGNSIVFIGVYGIIYGAQQRYVGTLRKYFFNAGNLSVQENSSRTFGIYPNPAEKDLYIRTDENLLDYEIYDLSGKRWHSGTPVSGKSIDVKDLYPGLYILKLRTEKGIVTSRFLKK